MQVDRSDEVRRSGTVRASTTAAREFIRRGALLGWLLLGLTGLMGGPGIAPGAARGNAAGRDAVGGDAAGEPAGRALVWIYWPADLDRAPAAK
jgi:hypothetical protein